MLNKLKIIVIGLGRQMTKDHIPSILRRHDLEIVAVVDKNLELAEQVGKKLHVAYFAETKLAIDQTAPHVALVSVPHNAYFEILKTLAENHVATLKEKPLAMTFEEGQKILNLYQASNTYLQVCVQRRFSKLYEKAKSLIDQVGVIYSIYIEYCLSLTAEDMKSGWRADKGMSGGGAVIDMGYHVIDLLTYILGAPDKVYAQLNYNSVGEGYTIEDTMKALMTFDNHINANIVITKVFNKKNEKIHILGNKGSLFINDGEVIMYGSDGVELESHTFIPNDDEIDQQLDYFLESYKKGSTSKTANDKLLSDQMLNMMIIDAIYESSKEEKVIKFTKELQ